jgi:aminopeptidase C
MEYRDTYLKFNQSKKVLGLTPKKFFRAFVEDRLREEIDFVREQLNDAGFQSVSD